MPAIQIIELSLQVIDKLLDQIPSYDERKKIKFKNLRRRYIDEMNREWRDDRAVDQYREELQDHMLLMGDIQL